MKLEQYVDFEFDLKTGKIDVNVHNLSGKSCLDHEDIKFMKKAALGGESQGVTLKPEYYKTEKVALKKTLSIG